MSTLPFFLYPFPSPFRAGVPGQLVPVSSGCSSRRRAVSRVFAYLGRRRGVRVGGSALPGLSVGETARRRLETEVSAPVGEVGRSRQAGAVPPRPVLPVGDWTTLLPCCFRLLGRPMSCALSAWAEPLRGSRSARDPGFMNPTQTLTKHKLLIKNELFCIIQ